MRRYLTLLGVVCVLLGAITSCKNTTKNLMPTVTGKAGEVLIVMNKALWEGGSGDTIKSMFSEAQVGLPQYEPLMDAMNVPPKAFTRMFRTHRSILQIRVSTKLKKGEIKISKGQWAKGQSYMKVQAPNEKLLIDLIQENRNKILGYFVNGEKRRLMSVLNRRPEKKIYNQLKKEQGFTISCPAGYNINKDEGDFVWLSKETPRTSQGLFIYSFDYKSQDYFAKEFLLKKRDSLLKANIPGPRAGSYMRTERRFPVQFKQFSFKDNYAVEMRGLWKVENDFMGGPFLNINFLDKKNNRVICLDGYVYYPNKDKRELLRELEAIMFTFEYHRKDGNTGS